MKEYRVQAYFSGEVYHNRTYKRKVTTEESVAKILYKEAVDYYTTTPCYSAYFEKCVIEEREVSDWRKSNENEE